MVEYFSADLTFITFLYHPNNFIMKAIFGEFFVFPYGLPWIGEGEGTFFSLLGFRRGVVECPLPVILCVFGLGLHCRIPRNSILWGLGLIFIGK